MDVLEVVCGRGDVKSRGNVVGRTALEEEDNGTHSLTAASAIWSAASKEL